MRFSHPLPPPHAPYLVCKHVDRICVLRLAVWANLTTMSPRSLFGKGAIRASHRRFASQRPGASITRAPYGSCAVPYHRPHGGTGQLFQTLKHPRFEGRKHGA